VPSNAAGAFLKGIAGLWYVWLIILTVTLAKLILYLLNEGKLAKSGIKEIDAMEGRTFERYLRVLFGKAGYKVTLTKYQGD
jgi:restriction system protein